QKKKEGWLERAGEFHWLPVWKIVSMQNGVTYRDYRSDFGETEIRSGKAALKISDLCADHELRIGLYGEIIYSELEQDSSKHEDWNITSSLSLCYKKIDFQPSYWYTQEEHVTAVTLSATDILIFNRIGLWAGVTKKYAVLSLPFTIRLALMQGLNLVLCNEPALEVSSYLNEIDANHYARTEGHLLHPLKPVDVKAALEINTAIPFTVYYRVQAVLDRRTYYYQEHDFYRIVPAHVVIQSPGIELSWHQGSFHIKNSFNLHDYRIYEKKGTYSFSQLDMEMPYESGLENITRLELDVGPARIESALIYLSSRKDETGSDLDEVFRIDLTISLQILENVKFTAGIDNILAREMTYFPGYPEDVRMLRGGFQIRF
ncbi:MAG: hypothetical protein JXB60_08695, partial [Candidatus Cloacimonetes bacterium]|nr:hypothetical protein [Candidatus Cloacimonadota bacterium]